MKPETIEISGTKVKIQFIEPHGEPHVGWATHSVVTADLDAGIVSGPSDNQGFELRGRKYRLGEHDCAPDGDKTVCTARIYEEAVEGGLEDYIEAKRRLWGGEDDET